MKRSLLLRLQEWQNRNNRKPLVLNGARQVGKTWLLKEFGRLCYKRTAYVNFESSPRLADLFSGDFDINRILVGLKVATGVSIEPSDTLIILDEAQACPASLTALKYFAENAPRFHVAAAGSLLGIAMHQGVSFPVGKVDFLHLYPLSFQEFLTAVDQPGLAELLRGEDWPLIETFRDKLIDYLRFYYCVGGMPEAVDLFVQNQDLNQVRELQKELLLAYEQDFSKYAAPALVPRIRAVWNSIPAQLAREQRKFVYGLVREGGRAREYEQAIEWLHGAGLVHKVYRVAKPDLPLKAYQELNAFKLFIHDVGLLAAHAEVPLQALLRGTSLFEEFKGALTEQYVAQELCLFDDPPPAYWSGEASQAEVDFLVQRGSGVYPVEVKAAENLQAKSLKVFRDKFQPPRCYRVSLSPYRRETWLTNLPLYAVSRLLMEMNDPEASFGVSFDL